MTEVKGKNWFIKIKVKKMKKYLDRFILAGIVLIVLVASFVSWQSRDQALAGWLDAYVKTSTVYTTTVGLANTGSSVASSTQILASNTERAYARCTNQNANGYVISVLLGSSATSTGSTGIILAPYASSTPASFFEINLDNPFVGAVYAYSQATSTITCISNH